MRISCSRAIKGVKSVELYRNRKIFKSTRKKKIFAQYSLMARVHVALQYLCGSATTTCKLALSVERLLRVTGQFRWSSLQLHDRKKRTRRLQLVKQRIQQHEQVTNNTYTIFLGSSFKIITSS